MIHRPPRRAKTRCSVAPPSRLYSAAVLSSFLWVFLSELLIFLRVGWKGGERRDEEDEVGRKGVICTFAFRQK